MSIFDVERHFLGMTVARSKERAVAPALEPLGRSDDGATTLGERVRVVLSERLMAGEYSPGAKLSLRKLADNLGVSMTPVRQAINRLVADRAVEVTPNRAVRVPTMTVTQFCELTEIRIDIEGVAAYRAATLRDKIRYSADDEIRNGFSGRGPEGQTGSREDRCRQSAAPFRDLSRHQVPMLVEIISGLWLKAGPILNLDMRSSPERLKSGHALTLHAAAVAAIARKDGEAARAAVSGDIRKASEYIIARKVLPP